MFTNEVCRKLEDIIHGAVIEEQSDTCTTIRNKLCSSFSTSTTVKQDFEGKSIIKKEQERFLQELAAQDEYWVKELPGQESYLAKGGEAKVYLHEDRRSVIKLMIVLKQPFIPSDTTADLGAIKELLTYNGFRNTRRQDYFYGEYGLILEDMHDENVILKDDTLFFIDTVFYVVQPEKGNLTEKNVQTRENHPKPD